MGTNPGSASYSRRQARRAGVGGGVGGNAGLSPTTSTDVTVTQFNASQADRTRQLSRDLAGEMLDTQLTRSVIRPGLNGVTQLRDIRGMTDRQVSTQLMNLNTRITEAERLINNARTQLTNGDPLSDRVRAKLNRTYENAQGGLNVLRMNRNRFNMESQLRSATRVD